MGGWQERTLGSVSPRGLSTAWGPAVSYHGEPGGPALAPSTSVDSRPEPLAQGRWDERSLSRDLVGLTE